MKSEISLAVLFEIRISLAVFIRIQISLAVTTNPSTVLEEGELKITAYPRSNVGVFSRRGVQTGRRYLYMIAESSNPYL